MKLKINFKQLATHVGRTRLSRSCISRFNPLKQSILRIGILLL
jgi:hypothetical protein